MTRARLAWLAVALASACGSDDPKEISAYSRRQAEIRRAQAEAEAQAKRLEAEMIAADGKHWFDVPKPGQLQPGLHECERYVTAMRSYAECDKLPSATRDGIRQSLDALSSSWRAVMSADGLAAANDGCRLGVQSMIDSALMFGCSLDLPP